MAIEFFILQKWVGEMIEEDMESFMSFCSFLEKKEFSVSDTSLTYREASYINKNLLDDAGRNKNEWRKFNLKEVIYLAIIKELRRFGIKDKQLINLKKSFFDKDNEIFSNIAILLTFQKMRIDIMIDQNLNIYFVDTVDNYSIFRKKFKTHINLNLNEYVMDVWEKISGNRIGYRDVLDVLNSFIPADEDRKMLDLINKEGYEEFYWKKKGKGKEIKQIITGIKRERINQKDLIKLVNQKFTTIKTFKEDQKGEDINIEIKKTHKI